MYQLHLPGEDGLHLGMTTLVLPRPPLPARYWFARELARDLTCTSSVPQLSGPLLRMTRQYGAEDVDGGD